MINSAKQFINQKNKRLTLLGMSGVGKTHLAKLIGEEGDGTIFLEIIELEQLILKKPLLIM